MPLPSVAPKPGTDNPGGTPQYQAAFTSVTVPMSDLLRDVRVAALVLAFLLPFATVATLATSQERLRPRTAREPGQRLAALRAADARAHDTARDVSLDRQLELPQRERPRTPTSRK